MFEIDEDLNRFTDDVVTGTILQVDDEAYAAGIVLVSRIVQSLRREGMDEP